MGTAVAESEMAGDKRPALSASDRVSLVDFSIAGNFNAGSEMADKNGSRFPNQIVRRGLTVILEVVLMRRARTAGERRPALSGNSVPIAESGMADQKRPALFATNSNSQADCNVIDITDAESKTASASQPAFSASNLVDSNLSKNDETVSDSKKAGASWPITSNEQEETASLNWPASPASNRIVSNWSGVNKNVFEKALESK